MRSDVDGKNLLDNEFSDGEEHFTGIAMRTVDATVAFSPSVQHLMSITEPAAIVRVHG